MTLFMHIKKISPCRVRQRAMDVEDVGTMHTPGRLRRFNSMIENQSRSYKITLNIVTCILKDTCTSHLW